MSADLGECGFHSYSYVRSAANYICELLLAGVNLEQVELFALRVVENRLDFGDNYARELLAFIEDFVFNLGSGEGELMNKLNLIKSAEVNKVGNPVH